MEAIPRKYGEWSQFDRYCKLVLYHEAIDYLREMKCRRDREVSLDAVSSADWDKLSTVDRYSCDSFTFSSHGYDLHIDNELVAEAFASLPKDEQSILILRFVLDLTDEEIDRLMGMSRSATGKRSRRHLKIYGKTASGIRSRFYFRIRTPGGKTPLNSDIRGTFLR